MPTQFPGTALDAFNNPTPSHPLNSAGVEHDLQHANANDAIEALEAKVGVDNSTVSSSLDYLIKVGAAWTAYTPTLVQSGAVAKTVTYARWQRVGRIVTVSALLDVTGPGTAANPVTVGLPVAAAAPINTSIGSGHIFDTSPGARHGGVALLVSTTTIQFIPSSGTSGVLGTAVFTAALAAGDHIAFTVTYEAAA